MIHLPCSAKRLQMISPTTFQRPRTSSRGHLAPSVRKAATPAHRRPFAAAIGPHDDEAGNKRRAKQIMLRARFKRFWADEDGAVTVDWLALTAAVVGVGMLSVNIVGFGVADASAEISATLRNAELGSITFLETSPGAGSTGSDASVGSLAP